MDNAGFLLLGDLNKPGVLDSPCLRAVAASSPWAVPLLHTNRDDASVFELIGPGTGHPDLQDLTAAATESNSVTPGGAIVWEWDWGQAASAHPGECRTGRAPGRGHGGNRPDSRGGRRLAHHRHRPVGGRRRGGLGPVPPCYPARYRGVGATRAGDALGASDELTGADHDPTAG